MTALKLTNGACLALVSTVVLLGFLALHDALHPAASSLLLVLICLVLPPILAVLVLMQVVRMDLWQVSLLAAVAVYVWIYAFALIGCAISRSRTSRSQF